MSQTFVLNHAAGLLARGHEVVVVPIMRSDDEEFATDEFNAVIAATAPTPAPLGGSKLARIAGGALRLATADPAARRFALAKGDDFPLQRVGLRLLIASRLANAAPFDVLHAHFGPTGVAAVALRDAGVFDAPIVCSFHGYDANVIAQQVPGIYDPMIGRAHVTAGTAFMRTVVENLGFPPGDVTVWPLGVYSGRFVPRRPGPADGTFRALSVARLVDFKGLDISIRAVAVARSRVPGLRYTIIGEGERRDNLERLAKALGVDDIVTFAGARSHDEVLAAFAHADVFLITGRVDSEGQKEGQGVAPLEAAASGLPVIAARAGGLTEVVVDGETGIVVEPENPLAAAEALVRLAGDAALRTRLGAAGRAHVEANFSHAHSLDVIEGVYRSVGRR
ncbi:MAG TPA: glycosyltransferase family 4 protein [Acidimicrobiales bacterium]|nr:glycosyltransferase family 4 protein [Acidimicrobiales bacterium]